MFRFSGNHFYRSYSLSIAERFLALCRFWSGDVRLLIVSFILQSVEY